MRKIKKGVLSNGGKVINLNLISLHSHGCVWNVFFLTANITSLIDLFWNNHKMDGCVLNRTKILKCRLCFIGNHLKEYIWCSCVRFIPYEPHFIRNSSLCMTDKQQSIVFMYYALVMPKYLKSNKQFDLRSK